MINYKYLLILLFIPFNLTTVVSQKKIKLKFDFERNMTWKQEVKVISTRNFNSNSISQIIDLTMVVNLSKLNDNKPSEIVCENVTGVQKIIEAKEINNLETESFENKNGQITANINENYEFINAKDHGKLSDDILLYFSPGPFIGFILPKGKIKLGDSWDSGEIIPVGPKTHTKGKLIFSEIKGTFQLTKIEKELAYILWKGKATVNKTLDAKWERTIIFDWKKKRFISNLGNIQIDAPKWNIIYQVDIIAKY